MARLVTVCDLRVTLSKTSMVDPTPNSKVRPWWLLSKFPHSSVGQVPISDESMVIVIDPLGVKSLAQIEP